MRGFPTGGEIIDQNRGGLIGKPVDRVDGWAKVTGAAPYAYETQEAGEALVGVMVTATIPAGRIKAFDTAAAEASPGVVLILTHANLPLEQAGFNEPRDAPNGLYSAKPSLASDQVRFYGDPIALVVADSFENARAAAALVRAEYERAPAEVSFEDRLWAAEKAPSPTAYGDKGDFDGAFAAAPVQIDAAFTTPIENHAQMEPHATLAVWEGEGDDERLHLFTSHQILKAAQSSVAATFKMPPKRVRIVSRFIGGGFGGKLYVGPDVILAAQAAKALGRPVKVALTRPQMFSASTHRTASRQRIRLGADRDGRLTAIAHEGVIHCARFDEFTETVGAQTRNLYAAPNRRIRHDLVHLDLPIAHAVRAPGEAIGMLALEAAMDELAEAVGLDPIELRVVNEPTVDPDSGKPYGSRSLLACMREGAARFGWDRRSATSGLIRDGRWLVGLGMSAAIRSNYLVPSKATLGLAADGTATVRQAMTDIGTGTYTILAQIAAEALGLGVEQVQVEIGDSDFPSAPGSGGSFGAASAGSALLEAAMTLREQIAELVVADEASPLAGGRAEEVVFADGAVFIGNRSERLTDVMARNAPGGLETHSSMTPPKEYGDYSQHAHGAHFAEVGVDPLTGEVRLRRMLGVFAAGRILNAKTARSQALGGMIWGVGQTLTEENHVDPRFGSFVAQDLASYHVPAHADIVDLDAVFITEADDHGNPLKIKGVGELGICGAGASVANAIYNACGVRLRDYPMTLDKVLAGMKV
jgi:xanthine dehydrogenase YagR molybdenum-binding subunit